MVRTYATAADLAAWMAPDDPPENTTGLIRAASLLIERATVTAFYKTDDAGMPTEPNIIEAFQNATCAQAALWVKLDIDPEAGMAGTSQHGPVASKSIGGATISYGSSAVAAGELMAYAAATLCDQSKQILRTALPNDRVLEVG